MEYSYSKLNPNVYYIEHLFSLPEFQSLNDEITGKYSTLNLKRETEVSSSQPYWYCLDKPDDFGIGDNLNLISATTKITYVIKKILKPKFDFYLRRLNTNIQHKYQDSSFHKDGYDGKYGPKWSWTFLLFSEMNWSTQWGGEFICSVGDGEYQNITYKPGSCVLFNGHLDHRGSSPNCFAEQLRTTIAWTYTSTKDSISVWETSYNNDRAHT